MGCDEYFDALRELGMNMNPICPTMVGGVLCNYHKLKNTTVLVRPPETLTVDERRAFVEEVTSIAANVR